MRMSFRASAAGLCLSAATVFLTLTAAPAGHAQQPAPPVPAAAPTAPAVVPVRPAAPLTETQTERITRATAQLTAANELRRLGGLFSMGDAATIVHLDLKPDATVREAARQLAEQTKREIVVDADVPESARADISSARLLFGHALDILSQAAGARWGREIKEGKTVYRIGKNIPAPAVPMFRFSGTTPATVFRSDVPTVFRSDVPVELRLDSFRGQNGFVYTYPKREERSTFTCPHCKRQATVIRKVETPKCPKCERVFQPSWQFCPYDGTRRPAGETTWKACPFCGKQVSRADTNEPRKTPSAPAIG